MVIARGVEYDAVRSFLDGTKAYPIQGDDPRSLHGRKIFTAARI